MPDNENNDNKKSSTRDIDEILGQNYNRQIIIYNKDDALGKRILLHLREKWRFRHPDCQVEAIDIHNCNEALKSVSLNSGDITRLYVVGHGEPGCDALNFGDKKNPYYVSFKELGYILAPLVKNKNVIINLISCAAGSGSKQAINDTVYVAQSLANSFAAQLHHEIVIINKQDTPVVARTHIMTVGAQGKSSVNLNIGWDHAIAIHVGRINSMFADNLPLVDRQPGSKILFKLTDEEQTRYDVYAHKWKVKLMRALVTTDTKIKKKKEFIDELLVKFDKMEPKDIFKQLLHEIENPNSVLKEHSSSFMSKIQLMNPATYTILEKLVKEGKKIFESKHVITEPVKTGKKL